MARIFISHSGRDNEAATRIKTWLKGQGFETLFLDFDKHAGIPPGADWERTLYRQIEQSEAVIIIQTPNWLDSKWCFAEFTQARALGKAIFPVIETPTGDTLISPDIQALDLRRDRDGGLDQLSRALTRIALDAQGGFDWDARRPPYPGLLAFQEEDAAVYFGRDDDIRRLIERLNARRAQGGAKLVALLGASGSGKSSLLRAGVIPRLKRAGRNWIVLPPLRPQVRPVDELARALAIARGQGADWRQVQGELLGGDFARVLDDTASDLRTRAGAGEAQILIPIDQAEELFGASDPGQAGRFLDILSQAMSPELPFLAVMAIRSDYLGLLQSAPHLTARFEEFSLGPMPLARIPQVIQGPARVAGLHVDEAFVQQAAHDAETEDALPLLAFALRELLDRSGGDGNLSLDRYKAMGDEKAGLTPLENAVRKAADGVLDEARPADDELKALREAFVPAMVRVNDKGEYVRRPARFDELPAKSHPLIERLARARLLIVRQDGGARMVEVAHEALLRKWPLLRSWLDDAREFLVGKQQLEQDLRDWENAKDTDKTGALLSGLKLNRARTWLADRPNQLTAPERAFALASIQHEEAEQRRRLRQRRIITRGAVAASLVLACAAGFAGFQWLQAAKAREQTANELIRYTWVDLGAKQEETVRLTDLANKLGRKPDELLPNVMQQQPDGFNCNYLAEGFRYLYCSIRGAIGFDKVQAVSGLRIFRPGGPHDKEINFNDAYRFGYYNPEFLDFVDKHLIPDRRDSRFNALSQTVYEAYIGPTARALYRSHEILFTDSGEFEKFKQEYQKIKASTRTHSGIGGFHTDPEEFTKIRNDYQMRIKQPVDQRAKDIYGGNSNGIFLENSFFWLSDYLLTVPPKPCCTDWYLASASAGFWVRRSIDGTEPRIFQLVKRLLETFEPSALRKT